MGLQTKTAPHRGPKKGSKSMQNLTVFENPAFGTVRTVEVERELTWIEQGQIYGFRMLAALITVWLIWRYRSKITNLIRKLI